jgi:hypothetical protein
LPCIVVVRVPGGIGYKLKDADGADLHRQKVEVTDLQPFAIFNHGTNNDLPLLRETRMSVIEVFRFPVLHTRVWLRHLHFESTPASLRGLAQTHLLVQPRATCHLVEHLLPEMFVLEEAIEV